MLKLPKIFLQLSSLLVLLFSGCAIHKYGKPINEPNSKYQNQIIPVLEPAKSVKYNTTIDVLKNHLSGIVIAKQTDSITSRVVFVTELGMKMFDMEIINDSVNAIFVFEPLNKPAIVNVLKESFKNMFLLNIKNKHVFKCNTNNNETVLTYKIHKQSNFLTSKNGTNYYIYKQENFSKKKLQLKTVYDVSQNAYQKITAKYFGLVKFYFELTKINE